MKYLFLSLFALTTFGSEVAETEIAALPPTFSVDYPNQDVRTVLRGIADTFELNVIIPDSLNGRTSLKLRDVSWQQAFEVILEPIGWRYEIDGQIILIKTKNPTPVTKDSDPSEMLSVVSAMQSSMAKSTLRDKDFAEAMADFYWNLYSALVARGFTKDQAMKIVVSTSADGSPTE